MNSSSTISSSKWLHPFLLFLLFTVSSSTSTPTISYSEHCASIIPEANPTVLEHTTHPLLRATTTHYTGGERILGKNSAQFEGNYSESQKSLSFSTIRSVYKTSTSGVFKIKAYLIFQSSNLYDVSRNSPYGRAHHKLGPLNFLLNGFWSESSGKLCMVGSASWYLEEAGKPLKLDAVLKLNYSMNSTFFNSLVSGSLESLSSPNDPTYFEPVLILAFPIMTQYNFTLVSEEFDKGCSGGIDIPPKSSLSLRPGRFCSVLPPRFNTFKLEYSSKCNSSKNCTPLGGGVEYMPPFVSLYAVQCSEEEHKVRYLVEFQNSSFVGYHHAFDPNTTLVGEGSWDGKKNRLCIVACRILNVTGDLRNSRLGDCSIRLSLRYPSVWSIRNTASIEGQIWTNKTANDLGYFDRITFQSSDDRGVSVPGWKYEYTEIDRVRRSCPVQKPVKKKGERYPNGYSYDMRFDMSVEYSKGKSSWGYAAPISTGSELHEDYNSVMISESVQEYSEVEAVPALEANTSYNGPLNISYKISFYLPYEVKLGGEISLFNLSWSSNGRVEISAEGLYDDETGHLCMVGCRNLASNSQLSKKDSMDCEILVNFQFPPVNERNVGGFIKGSIESKRKKNDPLYFEHLNMSSNAFYSVEAKWSIWRMDLEILMVLISNTFACVFVGLQLFHVKKHPNVLPSISILMLVILTFGHMIPLVLNFEALFLGNRNRQNVMLRSGGWVEVNEVIVRVVTMVAFLLQFRLLQQAWTSRLDDGKEKGLWVAEKKMLFVSLPLYILGGSIALFVNWKKNKYASVVHSTRFVEYQPHFLWGDLRSYAGLVLDGFLFPQILINIFQISRESVLSRPFYIGTTFVRLLPHAYDLYRGHNYVRHHFDWEYIYANPSADFYSVAWDVIIPCGGMLFAVIIYLQQRFGGRCFLPRRFRELEMYEKVPVSSSESS